MCIVFFSTCHPLQDLQHGFPFTRNCSPDILKTSFENVCRGSPHFFRPAILFESQNCFPTTTSGRRKGLCSLFSLGFISRQTQISDVKSQTPDCPCGPACSAARDTVNWARCCPISRSWMWYNRAKKTARKLTQPLQNMNVLTTKHTKHRHRAQFS